MDVRLSVIVASLDRAHLLTGTLEALERQVVPGDLEWETIVVDNGSVDDTPSVVAAFAATWRVPLRRVVEPIRGLSRARNRGIAEARGSIIAFTDDDVLPPRDWVAGIVAAIDRWDADGLGGRILPRWEAPPPPWLEHDPAMLGHLSILIATKPRVFEPPAQPQVWGANMAFRRSVFEAIGGFDERLGLRGRQLFRGEDTEFAARAMRHGFRVAYDPEVVVHHRIGPERMRRSYLRRLAFHAGQSRAITDHADGRRFLGARLGLYRVPLRMATWGWRRARRRRGAFGHELRWRSDLGQLVASWRMALTRPPRAEAADVRAAVPPPTS
jgi:GT2 family glycosyltransferase